MKNFDTFLKAGTLAVFILLIGAFVVLKAGLGQDKVDEVSVIEVPLSSSKSAIMMNDNNLALLAEVDSEKVKADTVALPQTIKTDIPRPKFSAQNYAASSKSMMVLQPGDLFYVKQLTLFEKFGLPEPFSPHKPFIIDSVNLLNPIRE